MKSRKNKLKIVIILPTHSKNSANIDNTRKKT
jgi:hypothetical protein